MVRATLKFFHDVLNFNLRKNSLLLQNNLHLERLRTHVWHQPRTQALALWQTVIVQSRYHPLSKGIGHKCEETDVGKIDNVSGEGIVEAKRLVISKTERVFRGELGPC